MAPVSLEDGLVMAWFAVLFVKTRAGLDGLYFYRGGIGKGGSGIIE